MPCRSRASRGTTPGPSVAGRKDVCPPRRSGSARHGAPVFHRTLGGTPPRPARGPSSSNPPGVGAARACVPKSAARCPSAHDQRAPTAFTTWWETRRNGWPTGGPRTLAHAAQPAAETTLAVPAAVQSTAQVTIIVSFVADPGIGRPPTPPAITGAATCPTTRPRRSTTSAFAAPRACRLRAKRPLVDRDPPPRAQPWGASRWALRCR